MGTSHKLVLMICQRCRLVLQFSAGRGIFDFDRPQRVRSRKVVPWNDRTSI